MDLTFIFLYPIRMMRTDCKNIAEAARRVPPLFRAAFRKSSNRVESRRGRGGLGRGGEGIARARARAMMNA